ncbi:MAG: hypothetical protein H7A46_07100 [Verrucomicrobiales bacterium]|nr:hypothetical protein [Verrucomicrobiales bacterium]
MMKPSSMMTNPYPARRIRVVTDKFEFSHGHAPRGFGWWWFQIGDQPFQHLASYAEARRRAVREASVRGATFIELLP